MSLLRGASSAFHRGMLPLAFAALPALFLASLETLDETRVEDVLLRLPGVVLRLPTFPFHVVLDFALKLERATVNDSFILNSQVYERAVGVT